MAQEAPMTVPTDKTYPPIATNSAWQKKKAFLDKAKAATKTGLGAKLTTAEASWKAIAWAKLDAAAVGKVSVISTAKNNLQTATTALTQVNKAKSDVQAAHAEAIKASNNGALSKTAKTAASDIAQALQKAELRLDKVNTKDFQTVIDDLEKAAIKVIVGLSVTYQGHEVMTADTANWDAHSKKLTITKGIAWQIQTDYMVLLDKPVTVSGRYATDNSSYSNSMKVASAGAKAASFES
jgi:hypothetical protein